MHHINVHFINADPLVCNIFSKVIAENFKLRKWSKLSRSKEGGMRKISLGDKVSKLKDSLLEYGTQYLSLPLLPSCLISAKMLSALQSKVHPIITNNQVLSYNLI